LFCTIEALQPAEQHTTQQWPLSADASSSLQKPNKEKRKIAAIIKSAILYAFILMKFTTINFISQPEKTANRAMEQICFCGLIMI